MVMILSVKRLLTTCRSALRLRVGLSIRKLRVQVVRGAGLCNAVPNGEPEIRSTAAGTYFVIGSATTKFGCV